MQTSLGELKTLDFAIPVFLPGVNRDWSQWAGFAGVSEEGEIFIKLMEREGVAHLIDMAQKKMLMQLAFDYKLSEEQIKEINEVYTKKIVSRVGSHPIGSDTSTVVGTAHIQTDGRILLELGENPGGHLYIDTNQKVEPTATITTEIKDVK